MTQSDRLRWDNRYQTDYRESFVKPRPFLVECESLLPKAGICLDLAIGLGGNAAFIVNRGLRVIGIDISRVALQNAHQFCPQIMLFQADLSSIVLPDNTFDLILNFYFLNRDLCRQIQSALRPGGILIFETLTQDMRDLKPEIEEKYLLDLGEARQLFHDLELLDYREGWITTNTQHPRAVASLVARKHTG